MPARAVLAQVFQLLTLVRFLDVYQRFTYVDHTNQPSPIPDEASRFASHLTAIPAIRYIVTRASHPAVTRDACRVRLPLTEERVSLLTGKKTSSLLKQLHHRLRVAHPPILWISNPALNECKVPHHRWSFSRNYRGLKAAKNQYLKVSSIRQ